MVSLESCLASWPNRAELNITYKYSGAFALWPGLVPASLSKGWVTLQPFPQQELRHQLAEKQGTAHVSARSHREIQLCDFDLLPWFLLGWSRTATQPRATAPEGRGVLAPVFQSCSSAPLHASVFTYNPRGT